MKKHTLMKGAMKSHSVAPSVSGVLQGNLIYIGILNMCTCNLRMKNLSDVTFVTRVSCVLNMWKDIKGKNIN